MKINSKQVFVRYIVGSGGKFLSSYIHHLFVEIATNHHCESLTSHAEFCCPQNGYHNHGEFFLQLYESDYADFNDLIQYNKKSSLYVFDTHLFNCDKLFESIGFENNKLISIHIEEENVELVNKLYIAKRNLVGRHKFGSNFTKTFVKDFNNYHINENHFVIPFSVLINGNTGKKEFVTRLAEFLEIDFNEEYYLAAKKFHDKWYTENQKLLHSFV